jgi:hypothetical protein
MPVAVLVGDNVKAPQLHCLLVKLEKKQDTKPSNPAAEALSLLHMHDSWL